MALILCGTFCILLTLCLVSVFSYKRVYKFHEHKDSCLFCSVLGHINTFSEYWVNEWKEQIEKENFSENEPHDQERPRWWLLSQKDH